jgi:hypothetical protein
MTSMSNPPREDARMVPRRCRGRLSKEDGCEDEAPIEAQTEG